MNLTEKDVKKNGDLVEKLKDTAYNSHFIWDKIYGEMWVMNRAVYLYLEKCIYAH